MKTCSRCKETKPFEMFHKNKSHKDGYHNQCADCCRLKYEENREYRKAYATARRESDFVKQLLAASKARAKQKGWEFNLEPEDIHRPTHCRYLECELDYDLSTGRVDNRASLDRIDNSKGYVKGNVQIISYLANLMKRDASVENLLKFAVNIQKQFR